MIINYMEKKKNFYKNKSKIFNAKNNMKKIIIISKLKILTYFTIKNNKWNSKKQLINKKLKNIKRTLKVKIIVIKLSIIKTKTNNSNLKKHNLNK